jgi:hypothetical protein
MWKKTKRGARMDQSNVQLSPEITAKFTGWEERYKELSLDVWNNLSGLKQLRNEIKEFDQTICETLMSANFDNFINQHALACELMNKIFESIIHQCILMKG